MATETYRIDFDEIKTKRPDGSGCRLSRHPRSEAKERPAMERAVPILQGRRLFRRQQRRRPGQNRRVQLLQMPGRRRPDRARLAFARPSAQRPAGSVRRRQGTARAVPRGERGRKRRAANSSSNSSPQPSRERRAGFDPEAYAKTLDPAHEALAGLGVDPETFRQWKAGYASSGVNRGRLALPIAGKDGAVVGYFGRATKGESPTLTFPNGLNPHEHIFGADRVTSEPLYLVRDPIDV